MITQDTDTRAVGDGLPAEVWDIDFDASAHTVDLVIDGIGVLPGTCDVVRAEGTSSATDPGLTTVTFPLTSDCRVATAGIRPYAVIVDRGTEDQRTIINGNWPLLDLPG